MQSRGSREDRPRRDRERYGEGRDRYEPRESSETPIPERAVERPAAEPPAAEPPAAEPAAAEPPAAERGGEPAPSEKVEA
jgi:hypothetical protein